MAGPVGSPAVDSIAWEAYPVQSHPMLPAFVTRPGWRILTVLGIVDAEGIQARAFSKLAGELFRLPWVEAVMTRGCQHPGSRAHDQEDSLVEVLAPGNAGGPAAAEAARIASRINATFGSRLRVEIVDSIPPWGRP